MIFPEDVSRETMARLRIYEALLLKWNPKINLVSKSSLADAWSRHIQDSLQILQYAPKSWRSWVDLGSGGGFPGAVVAIVAAETNPDARIVLVESDTRKAAFLRAVIRETGVSAEVMSKRIEQLDPLKVDVVSARALADLSTLFEYSIRHGSENSVSLYPKGESWQTELTRAQESWSFKYEVFPSQTDSRAVVLQIRDIQSAKTDN